MNALLDLRQTILHGLCRVPGCAILCVELDQLDDAIGPELYANKVANGYLGLIDHFGIIGTLQFVDECCLAWLS